MVNDRIEEESSWKYEPSEDGPDVIRVQIDHQKKFKALLDREYKKMVVIEPNIVPALSAVYLEEDEEE